MTDAWAPPDAAHAAVGRECLSLAQLLARWSALEPERCRDVGAGYHVALDAPGGCSWRPCDPQDTAPELQAAVQDALAERALEWSLTCCKGLATACVIRGGCRYRVSTCSEAMSLLWAYLDALEETKPQSLNA
jgi:hypothetical protein